MSARRVNPKPARRRAVLMDQRAKEKLKKNLVALGLEEAQAIAVTKKLVALGLNEAQADAVTENLVALGLDGAHFVEVTEGLVVLGLDGAQAVALLQAVPVARCILKETAPTITEQREALLAMHDALKRTVPAFDRARRLDDSKGLGLALRWHLDEAVDGVSQEIDALLDSASELKIAVEEALLRMEDKKGQVRKTVSTLPIRMIHQALEQSIPLGSRMFEDVVQFVYDVAIGNDKGNPSAAIRKYRKSMIAGGANS